MRPDAVSVFKDTYLLDFLDLTDAHSEEDLQRALVANLRRFLIELGGDFSFVGERYRLQVGGRDFFVDLVFFHRGLASLVAFELKVEEFQPAHLGQLEFYLEALDRDVKKPHEGPSIGVLLCATQNEEVVEYALSRAVSPALVGEYQTQLPDKKLLQAKLHEFYELAREQEALPALEHKKPAKSRRAKEIMRDHSATSSTRDTIQHSCSWSVLKALILGRYPAKLLEAAQVVPLLIKRLSDRYNRIRDAAAYALSQRAESVLDIDSNVVPALLASLETSASSDWRDGYSGLDNGASACGHVARLLATISHRLTSTQRKEAVASVQRAIHRFTEKDTTVMFDSMGIQTPQFLKEQLGLLRKPRKWNVPDLLESLAYPNKQDRPLSCEECDRRMADFYLTAPEATVAAAIKVLQDADDRDAVMGAVLWFMTLGPQADSALPALDKLATGKLDSYARMQAKDAVEFIRKSLKVEPDVSPNATSTGSGRQRIAYLTSLNLSEIDRKSLMTELRDLLEHDDAYVRAGSAEVLAKLVTTPREASGVTRLLEKMLSDDAAVEVGITSKFEFEGRLYHWRQERRSPRVSAINALFALDQVPAGDRVLTGMLAESGHEANAFGNRSVPHRFPITHWRLAAAFAGGLSVADPLIRAARQQCRTRGWSGDSSAFVAERELADIIRQLSGRLV